MKPGKLNRHEAAAVRLAAIEALPTEMQDHALVDWPTVALLAGYRDVEHCREVVTEAGVELVQVSARKKLPRWGSLREWFKSRTTTQPQEAA